MKRFYICCIELSALSVFGIQKGPVASFSQDSGIATLSENVSADTDSSRLIPPSDIWRAIGICCQKIQRIVIHGR